MLSVDQILALSPDDASAKAAKELLAPAKWPKLGHNESAIWGECQGSGKTPYQVIIDVGGPSFKCSCPSRKFPCKHGLALYLLLAQKESAFTSKEPPAWVSEWLAARQQRVEKQAEKKDAKPEAPSDPEARPINLQGRWFALDPESRAMPMRISENDAWQLRSLSGGHPLAMFGEWLGDRWRPLSAWQDEQPTPCWTETLSLL